MSVARIVECRLLRRMTIDECDRPRDLARNGKRDWSLACGSDASSNGHELERS
jgi:hypothetical protein